MVYKLRVGKIPYLNLFPLFHVLDKEADTDRYEFVEGYPSALNRLLREGTIDLSLSSSIEFLRHRDRYFYLDGHSISSYGAVRSILLFSRIPIESLQGSKVYATHQSETSVALLRIILERFNNIVCDIETTDMPFEKSIESHSAYLSIGDEALIGSRDARPLDDGAVHPEYRLATINNHTFYIYDLGEIWYRKTGLPFVFALWIGRSDLGNEKRALVEQFKQDLDKARETAKKAFSEMSEGKVLPPDEVVSYWESIFYGLDDGCMKGLELFDNYLKEMGII
jgi:chorismate dehydratase